MDTLALLYAPTDQPRARQLARALGQRGLSCWLVDDHGAGLGRARAERVAAGVRDADAAVVLLTEVAIASGWAALEPAGLAAEALAGRPVTVVRDPGVEVPEGMRVDRVVGWTEGREAASVVAEVLGLEPDGEVLDRERVREQIQPLVDRLIEMASDGGEAGRIEEAVEALRGALSGLTAEEISEANQLISETIEKLTENDISTKQADGVANLMRELAVSHIVPTELATLYEIRRLILIGIANRDEGSLSNARDMIRDAQAVPEGAWILVARSLASLIMADASWHVGYTRMREMVELIGERVESDAFTNLLRLLDASTTIRTGQIKDVITAAIDYKADHMREYNLCSLAFMLTAHRLLFERRLSLASAFAELALHESAFTRKTSALEVEIGLLVIAILNHVGEMQFALASRLLSQAERLIFGHAGVAAKIQSERMREQIRAIEGLSQSVPDIPPDPLAPVPGRVFMPVELAFRELSNPDAPPEQTLTRCAEASALAESREDLPNAARAALYQGILEGRRGGVQAAQAALQRGLRLAHRAEDAPLAAHARRLLGDAALQAAHYEDARSWYAEAIARFEALGLHQDALRARLLLVPVQIEFGRLAEAAPHLTALRAALADPALPPDLARDAAAVLELGDRAAAQRASAAEAPVG